VTTIRTVATYEVVQLTHPRPVTERDELGMAVGRAIDTALSRYSHEAGQHLRPTVTSANRFASDLLDRELADADLEVSPADRERILAQVAGVLAAFRRSELFGLPRPRSRLILINERVGVYAQPDYWDRRSRFYEMKSYRAVPPPPDVALQLEYFQLAFAGLAGVLACFDRHATPVETTLVPVPPITEAQARSALQRAYAIGLEHGKEKVLEYVDAPTVRYTVEA
jgi:hypothetical protein